MPDPVSLWMVHLETGKVTDDVPGTLTLREDAMVFLHDEGGATTTIPLESLRKAKRLRASPVLLVEWADSHGKRRTAFYFVKPPPLHAVARDDRPPSFLSSGRLATRRQRRSNANYLTKSSIPMRDVVEEWAESLRRR